MVASFYFARSHFLLSFILYVANFAGDLVDGFFARKLNQCSRRTRLPCSMSFATYVLVFVVVACVATVVAPPVNHDVIIDARHIFSRFSASKFGAVLDMVTDR